MSIPADFLFKVGASEIGLSGIVLAANSSFIHYKIHSENCKRLDVSTLDLDIDQVSTISSTVRCMLRLYMLRPQSHEIKILTLK